MLVNLVRNQGIPAFAYPANDPSIPRLCDLKILYSDVQFLVSLEPTISTNGVDERQPFFLRYQGDNLMPGKTSLGNVGISFPDGSLDKIARHGQPRPRTLSLTLETPCSVWYPHSFGSRLHPRFHEFLTLARTTEVHILFDTNWLGSLNLARLQSVVEGSRQLNGVPVIPQFTRSYQQADWSIFKSIQDVMPGEGVASEALPSIEDAVHDAPPPYAHVSSKRLRDNRTSLTPDSPLPKRLLQDPCAPSPTERATSASSPSSKSTASSTATVPVDVFQDIVASAVEKVLPDMLRKELPSILQDMLPELFADSSSPSLPPTPRSSQIAKAHTRTPGHKPTLAAVFRAVISTHTETHIERIFTAAVDQASELYNSADNEVNECLSDARLEFATLQEDHITAFNDDCNEKLTEFKERLVEDKDEVEAHADEVVLRAYDRLNMVGNKMCCRFKCHHGAKDKQSELEQGRRAVSLPP